MCKLVNVKLIYGNCYLLIVINMTAQPVQEQRQEQEDGYFGRDNDGIYCYESAPERGGEVPTQDFIEMNEIIHKTHNVTREYSHRMGCIVDLLNNRRLEVELLNNIKIKAKKKHHKVNTLEIDLNNGLISAMRSDLFDELLWDKRLLDKMLSCLDITKIPNVDELISFLIKNGKDDNEQDEDEQDYEFLPSIHKRNTYNTADFPLYVVEEGEGILYLARRENNLLLANLKDALHQMSRTHYYIPRKNIESVINANSTLRIPLSELNLKEGEHRCSPRMNEEYSYFTIDLLNYKKQLNPTQRAFAERVYGRGMDFDKAMKCIINVKHKAGIWNLTEKIYVLNSNYVLEYAKKGAISCASLLEIGCDCITFHAVSSGLNYLLITLYQK